MNKKIQASYWLERDLHEALTVYCKKRNISKSSLIADVVMERLSIKAEGV